MKKYISADLRVINISAKDIIATSFGAPYNDLGYAEDGFEGGYVSGRQSYDEDYDMDYEEDY